IARAERALDVDSIADLEQAERRLRQRLGHRFEEHLAAFAIVSGLDRREADTVDRDALAELDRAPRRELERRASRRDTDAQAASSARVLDPGDLGGPLDDAGEHACDTPRNSLFRAPIMSARVLW